MVTSSTDITNRLKYANVFIELPTSYFIEESQWV